MQAKRPEDSGDPRGTQAETQTASLLHELRVHQIELEMQNEELRDSQRELEASRDRYAELYDFAPIGYLTLDGEGCVEQLNLCVVELVGWQRKALLGMNFNILVHGPDLLRWRSLFKRLRKSTQLADPSEGSKTSLALNLRRHDGTTLPVELHCAAAAQGRLRMAITDMSERHRAELALSESEQRFQQVLRSVATVAVQGYGMDGRTTYWNLASELLYGYTAEEAIGRNLLDLIIAPEMRATVADAMAQMAATGRPVAAGEMTMRCKDGSRVAVISSHVLLQAPGQAPEMFCVDIDISPRLLAEQALQSSLRDKEALLKEVHHRVKNNLQVIASLLRLEAGRSAVADTKAVLQTMQGRIRAMAQLHESLYRSGTFAAVDLGAYLGQVATQAFRTQVLDMGSVRLQLDMASLPASMDQAAACGLLCNELISNSLKHGFAPSATPGTAGLLKVSLQPVDAVASLWCLAVEDNGVGLNEDFEAKRQSSLGLQLVADLCGQIGGTLSIRSAPGQGTAFSITFRPQVPV
ncbi:PAS domain S-box protein [Roseateles sp.]|uniref:sensor histidine kinase n=1 Tax=Roseateles sp. TaxID=1971397 RepID=UPI00286BD569|nr:PAS domain S-box protein [Roseateles sp.]